MTDKIKGIPINSNGYGMIPKLVMQDRRLNIVSKTVYAYLNSFAGAGDSCFPSLAKMSYDLCISKGTLQKYLKELVDYGYIEIEQIKINGKFASNVYTLLPYTKFPYTVETDTGDTVYGEMDSNNNSTFNNNNTFNNNKSKSDKPTRTRFTPPSLEEVQAYCQDRQNGVNAEKWYNYYTANGWKVGKNPMMDWKAAVRTWEQNGTSDQAHPAQQKPQSEYDRFMSGLADFVKENE